MGLLDEIRSEGTRRNRWEVFLDQFTDEDRADLTAALRDRGVPVPAIARALRKRGIEVTIDQLYNYRRGMSDES